MSTDCQDASNISVTCYTTDVPYQTATAGNLEELLNLFRNFGSRSVNGRTSIEVFFPFSGFTYYWLLDLYVTGVVMNQLSQSVNRLHLVPSVSFDPVRKKKGKLYKQTSQVMNIIQPLFSGYKMVLRSSLSRTINLFISRGPFTTPLNALQNWHKI